MKDYSKIISFMVSTPWMMHPPAMQMMLEILDAHLAGTITEEQIRLRLEGVGTKDRQFDRERMGNVGVLNLDGPMFPKANLMTDLSGATSLDQFQGDLQAMLADDGIDSILLNIDSPGGSSSQVAETAAMILEGNATKPIYGIANGTANSAAYWLLSQCQDAYATPSGQVGSLGTYFVHTDKSQQLAMQGVKDTVIKAGRFKGITIEPLTPEGEAQLQSYVEQVNDGFINSVAESRMVTPDYVRENFGQGMIFTPERATEIGMIDGIATFDQVLGKASETGGTLSVGSRPGPQLSYDADKEHSEPGTGLGGEPVPREAPEEGDPAIEGGWRRDSPPPAYDPPEEDTVNREWLEARAEALGVAFSDATSDEELAASVEEAINSIVVPLASATQVAAQQRQFEQDYPEQAATLRDLAESTRARAASEFASQFERIEGTNQGLAPVVRDEIATVYNAIGTRSFNHEMLKELIGTLTSNDAKVTYGEMGSSRVLESAGSVPTDFREARKAFADLVSKAMTEDNLDQSAAIAHVSEQNPELAKMYAIGHVGH